MLKPALPPFNPFSGVCVFYILYTSLFTNRPNNANEHLLASTLVRKPSFLQGSQTSVEAVSTGTSLTEVQNPSFQQSYLSAQMGRTKSHSFPWSVIIMSFPLNMAFFLNSTYGSLSNSDIRL